MKEPLKLGIPKGSLQDATVRLFEKAGWKITISGRSYFPEINDPDIICSLCRAQEMSRYVESGVLDAGITGWDWIMENKSDVHFVEELVYSKVSSRPARWVLAVAKDSGIKDLEDLKGKRVATELVNFTKNYFAEHNIPVEVNFSWGATEAKIVSGLADAIVEVTETESTIKAHGLQVIKELMRSTSQLIANRISWQDNEKQNKIKQIALLLKGALVAEKLVALKMNVPKIKLQNVVAALPSLNAPTVSPLYNSDWFSVETVVEDAKVRELIPLLLATGAEGIIEYSLNKVI
ncbi:MAG: ATP phosphoribosyltransferase [Desulfarculales bacterium]|jgi:ATP phosphoribosyltransferase|nr:ATP phosphoribosyltransferase [Desulfarculales bacterium]